MARPKKENAEYHSHDKDMRNDPKIRALRKKFKHEGYAIYNMMLEVLTDADNFCYEWNPLNIEILSGDFDTENLEEIIKYCTDKLQLFTIENGYIFSLQHQKRFKPLLSKRKRDNNIVFAVENPHSKVKDSIVKESKVDIPTKSTIPKEVSPATADAVTGNKNLKKVKKEPDKPRDHWQHLVDTWFDFYKKNFGGEEPNFSSRNTGFFGKIVDLLSVRAKKKKAEWTAPYAINSLKYFLEQAVADQWLKEHFLLANLHEQFDAIFARAKQKTNPVIKTKQNSYSGFDDDLKYLVERCSEGQLDEKIIQPDYYDKMISLNLLKVGSMTPHDGTIEEKKIKAVVVWIKSQANTKRENHLKVV